MSLTKVYNKLFNEMNNQLVKLQGEDILKLDVKSQQLVEEVKGIISGGKVLLKQNNVLRIGVVGQVKAGKSSFLNSLIFEGESVLPKASTPMTAGLTIIEYSDKDSFEVDFYSKDDWDIFDEQTEIYNKAERQLKDAEPELSTQKEIDSRLREYLGDEVCSAKELSDRCGLEAKRKIGSSSETKEFSGSIEELQNLLEDYVGADGKFTSVSKSITLKLNKEYLKGVQIVDTPGVNDPIVSRENRTKEFLRACHGVFLLSYAGRFCDSSDMDFLNNRISGEGIGSIVLLASKFDSVLQEASRQYNNDLVTCYEGVSSQLKKAQQKAIENTNYKGTEPIFDVTSGISFSIYKKEETDWDSMEKHVVKQMSKLFPEDFDNDDIEDLKDTFNSISNLDEIREKYLEHEFKNKKNTIIKDKSEQYFESTFSRLHKLLLQEKENVNDRIEKLNSTSIESLALIEKDNEVLFGAIEKNIKAFVTREITSIDGNINRFKSNYVDFGTPEIRTENITYTITHDGSIWNTDKEFRCISINTYDSKKKVEGNLTGFLKRSSMGWSNLFNEDDGEVYTKIKNGIYNQIRDYVKTTREKDVDGFDTQEWLNIIDNALVEISSRDTLPKKEIEHYAKKEISNLFDSGKLEYRINDTYINDSSDKTFSIKEREVNNNARYKLNETETDINNMVADIEKKLSEYVLILTSEIKNVLSDLKDNIIKDIKLASDNYTSNLKKELEEKDQVISIYNNYLDILESLETNINSFDRKVLEDI